MPNTCKTHTHTTACRALSSHSVAIASGAGGGGGGNHWHIAPLHWAAWQGDAARVSVLLATGRADIEELDEQDRDGWSALHFAVRGRSAACLDLLLGAGADPGRRDAAHGTPLHLAAAAGSAECVAALLRRGACPAVEGKDGRTPLHEAAMRGHAGCVAALLAAGGTRTLGMKDGHGSTAAQYAEQHLARLQAAEQRAPYQQPADRLRDALEAAALLRKAAAGAGAREAEGAPAAPLEAARACSSPALPASTMACTSSAASRGSSSSGAGTCTPDGTSESLSWEAGSDASDSGRGLSAAAAIEAVVAAGVLDGGGSSGRWRQCWVCLEQAGELMGLVPCGHRISCSRCTRRLLSWQAAPPPRCPVCRAQTSALLPAALPWEASCPFVTTSLAAACQHCPAVTWSQLCMPGRVACYATWKVDRAMLYGVARECAACRLVRKLDRGWVGEFNGEGRACVRAHGTSAAWEGRGRGKTRVRWWGKKPGSKVAWYRVH